MFAIGGIVLIAAGAAGVAYLDATWEPDSGYEETVRGDRPMAWWRFDELSGTVARDSSGNGQDGRYVGVVGLGAQGALSNKIDTGISLNGTSSVIAGDGFDFTGLEAFSVEAWVKPKTLQASQFTWIVSTETIGPDGDRDGWNLYFDQSAGIAGFERLLGRRGVSALAAVTLPTDRYTYLVGTFDGETLRFYVDGRLEATPRYARPGSLAATESPLTIGSRSQPQTPSYIGTIDEVAIYDRALTPADVADHWETAS